MISSKWNTTRLISAASLGVLRLVLSLGGGAMVAATGIPAGGFLNLFVSSASFAFTLLLIGQFGAATLQAVTFSLLAIPLPMSGGPGFLPKILIGLVTGLIADIVFALLRRWRETWAAIIACPFAVLPISLLVVWLGRLFGLPGVEESAEIFLNPLILAGLAAGALAGGGIGWFIYDRLKNTTVVTRIQRGGE
jgi:ABC-type thiamin/hydroxymethylpyrimidine transport system permease subunit